MSYFSVAEIGCVHLSYSLPSLWQKQRKRVCDGHWNSFLLVNLALCSAFIFMLIYGLCGWLRTIILFILSSKSGWSPFVVVDDHIIRSETTSTHYFDCVLKNRSGKKGKQLKEASQRRTKSNAQEKEEKDERQTKNNNVIQLVDRITQRICMSLLQLHKLLNSYALCKLHTHSTKH